MSQGIRSQSKRYRIGRTDAPRSSPVLNPPPGNFPRGTLSSPLTCSSPKKLKPEEIEITEQAVATWDRTTIVSLSEVRNDIAQWRQARAAARPQLPPEQGRDDERNAHREQRTDLHGNRGRAQDGHRRQQRAQAREHQDEDDELVEVEGEEGRQRRVQGSGFRVQ